MVIFDPVIFLAANRKTGNGVEIKAIPRSWDQVNLGISAESLPVPPFTIYGVSGCRSMGIIPLRQLGESLLFILPFLSTQESSGSLALELVAASLGGGYPGYQTQNQLAHFPPRRPLALEGHGIGKPSN